MARINLTQRQYLLIAGGAIVVLLGVLAWFYFQSADDAVTPTNTTNQAANVAVVDVTTNVNTNPGTAVDPVTVDATRLAQFFTERYGSYTSESEFVNITNLKPYMTARMQQSADDFVRRQSSQATSGAFTEVVTKVLSTSITAQDSGNATIRLSTQRIETGDTTESQDIYYQDIILRLAYEGEGWLVDTASWQEKGIAAPESSPTNSVVSPEDLINQL
ncbi:MAG: hypothetical protein HZC01_01315 [Candidatus Kerfeldbacteria bacterium]|nr:hypothetical protein [Candidatus Kerfeldbacteria bacterium]